MTTDPFADLNADQRAAVEHGIADLRAGGRPGPLLVIAGAGSGKTRTLTARVARLILEGADPRRILLMTFTRRAAREMARRASALVDRATEGDSAAAQGLTWAGTFHAVGQRLLRAHAREIGLAPDFTVLDRSDAEDLMGLVRAEQKAGQGSGRRFPQKGACLSLYSYAVNARMPLDAVLAERAPQYREWADELKTLFRAYVEAKQTRDLLDYDDLLLYWAQAMQVDGVAEAMRGRFDHVLVDEYQDTNLLQADILGGLTPTGAGLTVVGDDAQAIYAFRAATVRNILAFPQQFDPRARVVTLETNYRAVQPILDAANAVIAEAARRYAKELRAHRGGSGPPQLVATRDETSQVAYVVERVLANRENGFDLRDQAVLVRAGYHSGELEIELTQRNIPFVKYGGLRFLEAAHVKDVLALLRWAENPRDRVAAFRVLQLLPGIGPATARRIHAAVETAPDVAAALETVQPPRQAQAEWPALSETYARLRDTQTPWSDQPGLARDWYGRHVERLHDNPQARMRDLGQLETIAQGYPDRGRFLTEVALDPPESAGDEAGAPMQDDDWLVISTIHSAKGQEYGAVYVLNVVDGCIPTDMATGTAEGIEEERRLLYVAMTRARDELHLLQPQRFYRQNQSRHGDGHALAPASRFLTDAVVAHFERRAHGQAGEPDTPGAAGASQPAVDLKDRMRTMWD